MKLFKNISTLYTLKSAAKKSGKNLTAKDLSPMKNAAMLVDNKGRIEWIGKSSAAPRKIKKVIDLKGKNVFPAFIDCHSHLVFAGNRAKEFELRNQGASYQEIAKAGGGILNTVKQTRKASKKDLAILAQERVNCFLRQGVTTIESKSGYGLNFKHEKKLLEVNQELKKARIISTYLGPHAKSPDYKSLDEYMQAILQHDLEKVFRKGLTCRADIFVEKGYFTKEHLKKYLAKARELKMHVTIHADQMSSTEIVDLAIENKVKSLDHLVYIQEKEIKPLAQSEVTAVMLPTAEKYIHIPYPPARKLLDQGCRVALATDFNPGSSPTQDLSFLGVLARLDLKMLQHEVFAAMSLNAAHALGLEKDLGSLEVGKYADFFISEADLEDFFYGVGRHPVEKVYREGKPVK